MPEFTIRINTNIPIARGLGSSAAMLACGGVAANAFCGEKLSKAELLSVLTEIEGHPDNLAPALYGGFTAAACEENKIFVTQHPVSEKLLFTALIPPFEVSTEKARAVLPSEIPFSDAVKQLSHIPLLLEAMKTGNGELLKIALLDRLHEPYRKKLIFDFDKIKSLAYMLHADAFFISGSGSSCIAVSHDCNFTKIISGPLKSIGDGWTAISLDIDMKGAKCI